MHSTDNNTLNEILRLNGDFLYHREGQCLEFKEQFSLANLADYFKDFAAFANNKGGYLIFGVKDSPRQHIGLNQKNLEQFRKIDPEKITGFLLNIFSSNIEWKQVEHTIGSRVFGVFVVQQSSCKPIIAKKDEGRKQTIKNADIYYRYAGRTQKIRYPELESIMQVRLDKTNQSWKDLFEKIAKIGPHNAAVLDVENSSIEKNDKRILVLDEQLASKLKFIREGEFSETHGAKTLKLVGDVLPVNKVEVIKKIKEDLIAKYPFTANELRTEVKKILPKVNQNSIFKTINATGMKDNLDYSAYNFRNKTHENNFSSSPKGTVQASSIYNQNAVDFLVNILVDKF